MDEPPVGWDRVLSTLDDPTAVEELRVAAAALQRNSAEIEADYLLRTGDLLLLRVDALLVNHPSPEQRVHLLQTAELLFRVAANAHRQSGKRAHARQLQGASKRLQQQGYVGPSPD